MEQLIKWKYLKKCLGLLGTLVILSLLFNKIGFEKILKEMTRVNILSLVFAFILYNLSQLLSSLRLYTLINCSHKLGRFFVAKVYYRSMFFSVLLPIGVGADAYKIWLFAKRLGLGLKHSSFIVIWERVIGVLALFSVLALLWNLEWHINDFVSLPLSLFILFLSISAFYLFLPKFIYGIDLRSNVNAYITSIGIHLCQISCFAVLASSLLDSGELVKAVILFLLSSLASFVPISFSGLGAREAVFVMGAKYLSLNVEALVAASLLFQIIHFSTAAIGSFVKLEIPEKYISLELEKG